MNKLFQQINHQNGNLSQIKKMMDLLKNANNPQYLLKTMIENNPQVKSAMDYINRNGGNPKDAFYKLAKDKGVNPEDILNSLK